MELVGPRYRKLASVITGLFFAVGQVREGGGRGRGDIVDEDVSNIHAAVHSFQFCD